MTPNGVIPNTESLQAQKIRLEEIMPSWETKLAIDEAISLSDTNIKFRPWLHYTSPICPSMSGNKNNNNFLKYLMTEYFQ